MAGMNYPGGTVDEFWKTIKIKQLPITEEFTRDLVVLVEDDQDTKQMKADVLFNAVERIANEMYEDLKARLKEVDEFMDRMKLKEQEYALNEQNRKDNNIQFIKDEQERRAQFEDWGRTWENVWNPYFDECQARENIRIANENERQENEQSRILEWDRWVVQITQWEQNEEQRQIKEKKRDEAEVKREQNVQDAIGQINQAYNDAIEGCEKATIECKKVTAKLDNMFEIGPEVPSDLDENKVYFQTF